jgi:hypothetical protein
LTWPPKVLQRPARKKRFRTREEGCGGLGEGRGEAVDAALSWAGARLRNKTSTCGGGRGLGLAATTITGSTTARGDKRGGRNGVEGSRLGGSGSGVGGGRNQGVGPIWEIGIKGWVGYGSSIKDGVGLWRGGKGGQG